MLASVLMAAALYGGAHLLAPGLAGGEATRALTLAALVAGGLVLFGLLAQITGAAHWRDLKGLRRGAAGPPPAEPP